jgi:hypothetical protein
VVVLAGEDLTPKEKRYREQRDLRTDHILRRVESNGLESLTTAERKFLERVAAELRFELGWKDATHPDYDEF